MPGTASPAATRSKMPGTASPAATRSKMPGTASPAATRSKMPGTASPKENGKNMYDLCRHLLASGRRCTQPAVSGTSYCRHHRVVKRTIADSVLPSKLHGLHKAIPSLYPEDRAASQANCFLVLRALDDRRINTQTANAMGRLLRTCELNLKRGPLHESNDESTPAPRDPSSDQGPLKPASGLSGEHIVRRVVLTPSGEEI